MEEIQANTSTGASRIFNNKDTKGNSTRNMKSYYRVVLTLNKAQRNDTTRRIEAEAYRICSWENPIQSGVILAIIVGSIAITNRYTFLQIVSGFLTIAVSVNLTYVCVTQFSQTLIADRPTTNPYR